MDIQDLFPKRSSGPVMSSRERQNARLLIVDADSVVRSTLRQALVSVGFESITDANDFGASFEKLEEKPFSHLIFDCHSGHMHPRDFLAKILSDYPDIVAIPTSNAPTVDEVFDLLVLGARGFLVKPFTTGAVDEAVTMATKGDPISDSVLNARTRNEALASLVLNSLNNLAHVMKQARQFPTARREVPGRALNLRRAVELGRTFAQGGPLSLRDELLRLLLERAEGNAVGGLRQRYKEQQEAMR